ncbi:MAG: hypothetical protein ACLPLP_23955 [Mycobacterium sp.]
MAPPLTLVLARSTLILGDADWVECLDVVALPDEHMRQAHEMAQEAGRSRLWLKIKTLDWIPPNRSGR